MINFLRSIVKNALGISMNITWERRRSVLGHITLYPKIPLHPTSPKLSESGLGHSEKKKKNQHLHNWYNLLSTYYVPRSLTTSFTLIISFNPYNKKKLLSTLYDSENRLLKITAEWPFAGTGSPQSENLTPELEPHSPHALFLPLSKPQWSLFTAWHRAKSFHRDRHEPKRHCLIVLSLILFFTFSSSIFIFNQAMIFLFNQQRSIMGPLQIYISSSCFSSYFPLI